MKKVTYLGSRIVMSAKGLVKGLVKGLINEFELVRVSGEEYALKRSGFEVVVNDGEFLVSICHEVV